MGSLCCLNRKEMRGMETNVNTNINTHDNKVPYIDQDYATEAITEDYLKKIYSNANKQENLEILLTLADNKSAISIDETVLRSNWLTKPETLGDVSIIQILNIIQKKVKGFILDEREMIRSRNKDTFQNKIDNMIEKINQTNLINKMLDFLESDSFTKKDVAILILCTLSASKFILVLLMTRDFLKRLIDHLNRFKKSSKYLYLIFYLEYKNYKEHIIATLQLFRRIYVKDVIMRKTFLEESGIEIINEFLKTEDPDIVLEVLYNIEDLIYNDEEEYQSISKLVIMEMVENLEKLDILKMLFELYQQMKRQRSKYKNVEYELKRLISVFEGKESIKAIN